MLIRWKFLSFLILSFSPIYTFANNITVNFNNGLSQCMRITTSSIILQQNLILAKSKIQLIKTTDQCGCSSAMVNYVSNYKFKNNTLIQQWGKINLLIDPSEKFIVLSSRSFPTKDAKQAKYNFTVDIECAIPD